MSSEAKNPAALLQALMAANLTNTFHPSFWIQVFPETFPPINHLKNPFLKLKLQAYAVRRLSLEPISYDVLVHNPYCALLDAEPEHYRQLEILLGALYHLDAIRKIVNRLEKNNLITEITPPIYSFILKQGTLYAPKLKQIKVSMPEGDLASMIPTVGHFFLEYIWEQQPESLIQRFTMKFNASKKWNFRHIVDPMQQEHLFVVARRLLQKIKAGLPC